MKPLRRFVPLDKSLHKRIGFDCGVQSLNIFLQQSARRGMDARVSYTWVLPAAGAAKGEQKHICAWYTLTVAHIEHRHLPEDMARHLPHYPLPVFVLAQLAVDKHCQGYGLGEVALINALRRCAQLSRQGKVPSVAVVVDVLNHEAMQFYRRYPDFRLLESSSAGSLPRLFIPMHIVGKL
ncbi:MAG: hypothetical protein R8K50_04450 [Mariprofundus sp.]